MLKLQHESEMGPAALFLWGYFFPSLTLWRAGCCYRRRSRAFSRHVRNIFWGRFGKPDFHHVFKTATVAACMSSHDDAKLQVLCSEWRWMLMPRTYCSWKWEARRRNGKSPARKRFLCTVTLGAMRRSWIRRPCIRLYSMYMCMHHFLSCNLWQACCRQTDKRHLTRCLTRYTNSLENVHVYILPWPILA